MKNNIFSIGDCFASEEINDGAIDEQEILTTEIWTTPAEEYSSIVENYRKPSVLLRFFTPRAYF